MRFFKVLKAEIKDYLGSGTIILAHNIKQSMMPIETVLSKSAF